VTTETGRLDRLGVIELSIINDAVKADFLFEGRHVVINVLSDLMFSEIALLVGAELGVPATSLEFKLGTSLIDPEMCVDDFGGETKFNVTVLPAPVLAPGQFEVAFSVEQRNMNFTERFNREATVRHAKSIVADRLRLP
jgi:hypothetical protein